MPFNLRLKIEKMLDTSKSLTTESWRIVGKILGMEKIDIDLLAFRKVHVSPTSQILEWLEATHPNTKVRYLADVIHRAGLEDVVQDICNWNWASDNDLESV